MKKILLLGLLTLFGSGYLTAQDNALDFDGTNDFVEIDDLLTSNTSSQTVSAWVRISSSFSTLTEQTILQRGTNPLGGAQATDGVSLNLQINSDRRILANIYPNGNTVPTTATSITVLDANTWYYISLKYETGVSGGVSIYVNGAEENRTAKNSSVLKDSSTPKFFIGKGSIASDNFSGQIDEVRVWNTALSDAEVEDNFDTYLEGTETNLVAYYQFNRGTPNANNTGASLIESNQVVGAPASTDARLENFALNGSNSNFVNGLDCTVIDCRNALDFDGTDDVVTTAIPVALPNSSSQTIEAYVNFAANPAAPSIIIQRGRDATNTTFSLQLNTDGTVQANAYALASGLNTQFTATNSTVLSTNTWHHLAVVYTRGATGGLQIVVNGSTANSTQASFASVSLNDGDTDPNNYSIGSGSISSTTSFYDGLIDEIRIWNTDLDVATLDKRKSFRLKSTETNLVIHYRLDQGIPSGNNAGLTTANDAAALGGTSNGTLVNFSLSGTSSNWVRGNQVLSRNYVWNGTTLGWNPAKPGPAVNALLNANYDVATSGNISANNLTISSGNTLTQTSGSITLRGKLTNNGNAFDGVGLLTMNGTTPQTVKGAITLDNLTINNTTSVTLLSDTNLKGVLTLTNGILASGGALTFRSLGVAAGSSARLAPSGAGSIAGDVTVERFMDGAAQEGYRYLATNVKSQLIDDIQLSSDNTPITLIGLGSKYTPIDNPGYTWYNTSPFPNIFTYNQALVKNGTISGGILDGESEDNSLFGWNAPSVGESFNIGRGVALRVGNSNAVADFTGEINVDPVTVALSKAVGTNSGWFLVGNPYPATLDWDAVYNDNTANIFDGSNGLMYTFDAGDKYTGTYSSFNAATNATTGSGTQNIASGQAFFIRSSSAGGTLSMNRSQTVDQDATFFRTKNTDWEGQLRMKLIDEAGHEDELLIYLIEGMRKGVDVGDAQKFFDHPSGFPRLASTVGERSLLMDCREPLGNQPQVYNLDVTAAAAGTYTLQASDIANFVSGTEILLVDALENITIDLNQVEEYVFELSAGENVKDRFSVHLSSNRVTSLESDLAERGVAIYGSAQLITIKFSDASSAESFISVYDVSGRLIAKTTNENQLEKSVELTRSGIYIVRVENKNGLSTKKVFVE